MATYTDMSEGLRAGMRRLAASVNIISSIDSEGNRHAMTATAVTSLSDSPASLLICVNKSASLHPVLSNGANFCVNVLSNGQDDISNTCAGKAKGEERFAVGNWANDEATNLPYLTDAQVSFFCKNVNVTEFGTHIIVIGEMTQITAAEGDVEPLIYVDGGYKTV